MLIITRREGSSFEMNLPDGSKITVHVLSATTGQTRIGIDAPQSVSVLRDDAVRKHRESKTP